MVHGRLSTVYTAESKQNDTFTHTEHGIAIRRKKIFVKRFLQYEFKQMAKFIAYKF